MFVMIIIVNLAVGHHTQVLDNYPTWTKCEQDVPAMRAKVGPDADVVCIPTSRHNF